MKPELRYVVLHHTGVSDPHYDLMCEWQNRSDLITLRFAKWPPDEQSTFTRLANHRRAYLEYEGPISGNRGSVSRVQSGHCAIEIDRDDSFLIRLDHGIEIRVGGRPG
jgi:hypothetical protein